MRTSWIVFFLVALCLSLFGIKPAAIMAEEESVQSELVVVMSDDFNVATGELTLEVSDERVWSQTRGKQWTVCLPLHRVVVSDTGAGRLWDEGVFRKRKDGTYASGTIFGSHGRGGWETWKLKFYRYAETRKRYLETKQVPSSLVLALKGTLEPGGGPVDPSGGSVKAYWKFKVATLNGVEDVVVPRDRVEVKLRSGAPLGGLCEVYGPRGDCETYARVVVVYDFEQRQGVGLLRDRLLWDGEEK